MTAIPCEMECDGQHAQELGLTPEEIAFCDAVVGNFMTIYDRAFLRNLIHEVIPTLKRILKIDWNEPPLFDDRSKVLLASSYNFSCV